MALGQLPGVNRGSSPRGRGKQPGYPQAEAQNRLIPAWAGKTLGIAFRARSSPAHPRVGGENLKGLVHVAGLIGSSPRGRGKHGRLEDRPLSHRLIPAWAGKTCCSPSPEKPRAAHPRVGGENIGAAAAAVVAGGSSPRGRGKPPADPNRPGRFRLIPAWAGKTPASAIPRSCQGAHPRVGGENRGTTLLQRTADGSSPRGRGKLPPR